MFHPTQKQPGLEVFGSGNLVGGRFSPVDCWAAHNRNDTCPFPSNLLTIDNNFNIFV